ncbi:hypothetical protein [Streptomyces sp. 4N124]|uniref:hypothetical protein n=1 Tax=Streptomyces sp. 4N124 TaxID=3457420 RepID=UPI003FD154B5
MPTTFLNTTFYFQGFLSTMGPKRAEDGVLTLTLPLEDGKLLAGGLGVPAGEEIANMFQYYGDIDKEFPGHRDLHLLREINPALQSFPRLARRERREHPGGLSRYRRRAMPPTVLPFRLAPSECRMRGTRLHRRDVVPLKGKEQRDWELPAWRGSFGWGGIAGLSTESTVVNRGAGPSTSGRGFFMEERCVG